MGCAQRCEQNCGDEIGRESLAVVNQERSYLFPFGKGAKPYRESKLCGTAVHSNLDQELWRK